MKTRIIETEDNYYMPQFKLGFLFGCWRFFDPKADTAISMRVIFIEETDPAKAASFYNERDAKAFLDKVLSNAASYWKNREEALRRQSMGVKIKRVVL